MPYTNLELKRANRQAYLHNHPEKAKEYNARYYVKNSLAIQARRYGMTKTRMLEMLKEQEGLCAGCGDELGEIWDVDHDHACCPGPKSCGKCVRALLCHHCNLTLGWAKEDAARLRGLADLLDRSHE